MENVLKFLYSMPRDYKYEPDSALEKTVRIRNEYKDTLDETMTDKQKELLEAYLDADAEIESFIRFDYFCYAVRFGAGLMKELTEGEVGVL